MHNPTACNFNGLASDDDGSCVQFDVCGVYAGPGLAEGTCGAATCWMPLACAAAGAPDADGDGVCDRKTDA